MPTLKKFRITPKQLKSLHLNQLLSPQEMADVIGCTRTLIYYYLHKFNINIRPKNQNLLGHRFHYLIVKEFLAIDNKSQATWLCQCDCGNLITLTTAKLNNGQKSCGCYQKEKSRTHNMSNSRPYRIWLAMKSRCNNSKAWNYDRYGKKGIVYCDRWAIFENFWKDMKDSYLPHLTLHRKDNDRGYCLENCCWASVKEQNNLKSNSVLITYNGQTLNVTQWAEKLKMSRHILYARKRRGWGDEQIITTPNQKHISR
jgi:hypothetical protein